MAQKIKQGSIWGRMGQGFGEGLAESVPKEVENYRLKNDLAQLEKDAPNLTPLQLQTRLAGIPNVTPEASRQIGESARFQRQQENVRNKYGKGREDIQNSGFNGNQPNQKGSEAIRNYQVGQQPQGGGQVQQPQGQSIPSGFQNRGQEAESQANNLVANPYNQNMVPVEPWTKLEKEQDIIKEFERNPEAGEEAAKIQSDLNEQRRSENPLSYQARQTHLENQEKNAISEFKAQLSARLEKEGTEIYTDIPGNLVQDAQKAMINDLITDPTTNAKKASEKWSKKLLDYAENKNKLKEIAGRSIDEKFHPDKKKETLRRLKVMQPVFDDLGQIPEFNKILQSELGLSPAGSALVSSPRSEPIQKLIKDQKEFGKPRASKGKMPQFKNNFHPNLFDPDTSAANSRKFAEDVAKTKTAKDSFLAIGREMSEIDPSFDMSAYIYYLTDNASRLGITPNDVTELGSRSGDWFASWGDFYLFPSYGRSLE